MKKKDKIVVGVILVIFFLFLIGCWFVETYTIEFSLPTPLTEEQYCARYYKTPVKNLPAYCLKYYQ